MTSKMKPLEKDVCSYRFSELTRNYWSHHARDGGKGVGDSEQDPGKPAHTHSR